MAYSEQREPARVTVRYHEDHGSWRADSPDLPDWVAAADSFLKVRELAREGVAVFLGPSVEITEEGVPGESGEPMSRDQFFTALRTVATRREPEKRPSRFGSRKR